MSIDIEVVAVAFRLVAVDTYELRKYLQSVENLHDYDFFCSGQEHLLGADSSVITSQL